MKLPGFWSRPSDSPGWQARALAPLSAFATRLAAKRAAKSPALIASIPVICIGNINLGGSGKTPTAIEIAARLQSRNLSVHIVSRGYGGKLAGPVRVDESFHRADDVGDEPLLLAAFAPTWVAKDRAAGVAAAQAMGAEVVLLDDGFQNPSVFKTCSIVVVDAKIGFGNGLVFPAGPLREPIEAGLERADLVLAIGNSSAQQHFHRVWDNKLTVPLSTASLQPLETGMDWDELDVLPFAGIGHPEKFFETLRALGANIIRAEALDDHQPLTAPLMKRLELEAKALNAQLVTTEKDAVRLPKTFRQKVLTLPVRLNVPDWAAIDKVLAKAGL